ncbi:MAG: spore coat protein [Bacilli bacterium]
MNDNKYSITNILSDLLLNIKGLSSNLTTMINEMSNDYLFDEIYQAFDITTQNARMLYNEMLKRNLYTIKTEDTSCIQLASKNLFTKLKEMK